MQDNLLFNISDYTPLDLSNPREFLIPPNSTEGSKPKDADSIPDPEKILADLSDRSLDKALSNKCLTIYRKAEKVGCTNWVKNLPKCGKDCMVFQLPDGSYKAKGYRCGNRMCPICTREKSREFYIRIAQKVEFAKTFWTFTIPTHNDYELGFNLALLSAAWRDMSNQQGPRSKRWIPFKKGYIWKIEVTDGEGFHPHLHVLSVEPHLSIEKVTSRWSEALQRVFPRLEKKYDEKIPIPWPPPSKGFVFVRPIDSKAILEMSKYLTKSIGAIDPNRWDHLCRGLCHRRVYGSGGILTIPPISREPMGWDFVGFGSWLTRNNENRAVLQAVADWQAAASPAD